LEHFLGRFLEHICNHSATSLNVGFIPAWLPRPCSRRPPAGAAQQQSEMCCSRIVLEFAAITFFDFTNADPFVSFVHVLAGGRTRGCCFAVLSACFALVFLLVRPSCSLRPSIFDHREPANVRVNQPLSLSLYFLLRSLPVFRRRPIVFLSAPLPFVANLTVVVIHQQAFVFLAHDANNILTDDFQDMRADSILSSEKISIVTKNRLVFQLTATLRGVPPNYFTLTASFRPVAPTTAYTRGGTVNVSRCFVMTSSPLPLAVIRPPRGN